MIPALLGVLLLVAAFIAWLLLEIRHRLDVLIDVQIQRVDAMTYERKEVSGRRL